MNEFDIPIFKKSYELYKEFYLYVKGFPKAEKYAIGQKCENLISEILESLLTASTLPKIEKLPHLNNASNKLNLLRVYLRLAKDIKVLDNKKYVSLEVNVDEVGKMLGGWQKAVKQM